LNCIQESPSIQQKNLAEYNIRFAEQRTKRLLKKRFARTEDEYNEIAKLMIVNKKQFLLDRINGLQNSITN